MSGSMFRKCFRLPNNQDEKKRSDITSSFAGREEAPWRERGNRKVEKILPLIPAAR